MARAGRTFSMPQLVNGVTYNDSGWTISDRHRFFVNHFSNTKAFVPVSQLAAEGSMEAARNIISGPALNNNDFNVDEGVMGREPLRVQLRGEFFNAFNQVQPRPTNVQVSLASFGQIRPRARAP